jgi:hypothetical protein
MEEKGRGETEGGDEQRCIYSPQGSGKVSLEANLVRLPLLLPFPLP